MNGSVDREFRDCQDFGKEYIHVSDSQDLNALFESIGKPQLIGWYGGAFVLVGDGEILECWCQWGKIPYTYVQFWREL